MATSTLLETRNVIVVGRTGSGKSTVANHILGSGSSEFKVEATPSGVTTVPEKKSCTFFDEDKNTQYCFNVIDTVGLFDPEKITNEEIMKQTRDAVKSYVDGLHVIVFVIREGRMTQEEQKTFDIVHADFSKNIDPLSFLVITGCEGRDRSKIVDQYKTKQVTKNILSHMEKGVIGVGFPDLCQYEPDFREVYKKQIMNDAQKLRDAICQCKTMYLRDELYYVPPPSPPPSHYSTKEESSDSYTTKTKPQESSWCNIL